MVLPSGEMEQWRIHNGFSVAPAVVKAARAARNNEVLIFFSIKKTVYTLEYHDAGFQSIISGYAGVDVLHHVFHLIFTFLWRE
mgnify:CR=1 FL=1